MMISPSNRRQRIAETQFPGLFLVGTDTGVGKTTVASALLRLLADRGHRPVPYKPVETGADPHPKDAIQLREAANRTDIPLAVVCPLTFSDPISPAAAASAANKTVPLSALVTAAKEASQYGDLLIVESAGGLLSPYATGLTTADLATALGLPLILVARNSLGTINHTALAVAEIRRRAQRLLGIILVNTHPTPSPDQNTNASLIKDQTGITPLGVLPFIKSNANADYAHALQASVDLTDIFTSLLT